VKGVNDARKEGRKGVGEGVNGVREGRKEGEERKVKDGEARKKGR
jgi:hypothetical protein